MPRPAIKDGMSKHARYRAMKRAEGFKELRLWVPDRDNPDFKARLKRDMEAIRNSESEAEAVAFAEAITDWPPYEE